MGSKITSKLLFALENSKNFDNDSLDSVSWGSKNPINFPRAFLTTLFFASKIAISPNWKYLMFSGYLEM